MVGPPIIGSVIGNLVGERVGEKTTKEMGLDKAAGQVSSFVWEIQALDDVFTNLAQCTSF